MKFAAAFVALAIAAISVAQVEVERNPPPGGDTTILQYALTLEHLEAFFYAQALEKFSEWDFKKAGYPAWIRQRVVELASDEAQHVAFLTQAIGAGATQACSYKFPYETVDQFLALSRTLEGVGVSAYLGAAGDISVSDYVTAAGSILTVEARHNAVLSEIEGDTGFPAPFDTPLGYSNVYTLASSFITSCPPSNPSLPVQAFPSLRIATKNPRAGKPISLRFKVPQNANLQLHVLNGLNDFVVPCTNQGMATLPAGLTGRVYLVLTNGPELSDANTIAGPALIDLPTPGVIPSFEKQTKWGRHHSTKWGRHH